jgi:phytoene dehydrogenase-like protein
MKNYDVIVIGAGPGGSAAAALLAKEGKKVLLVDKNKSAGGKMMTIHDKDGFHESQIPDTEPLLRRQRRRRIRYGHQSGC